MPFIFAFDRNRAVFIFQHTAVYLPTFDSRPDQPTLQHMRDDFQTELLRRGERKGTWFVANTVQGGEGKPANLADSRANWRVIRAESARLATSTERHAVCVNPGKTGRQL